MESFNKKAPANPGNAAPGSQQEIPIAPPNVYKKENIPKQSNPEDLKTEAVQIAPFTFAAKKEEEPKTLHSARPIDSRVIEESEARSGRNVIQPKSAAPDQSIENIRSALANPY